MRILIVGASGLVGSALSSYLSTGGHDVWSMTTSKVGKGEKSIRWSVKDGIEGGPESLEGFDAVVHLAGTNIAGRKWWNDAHKKSVRDSRVLGTRLICEAMAGLSRKPSVFICASAVGVYGNRGDEELTENSQGGTGFLAEVGRDWEAACEPARKAGIRVSNLRFGIILSPLGGALKEMLPPFVAGVGGRLGSGRQWWSWVGIDDVLDGIQHVIATENLDGPVNMVSPSPATNMEFTRAMASVLGRFVAPPVPEFVLRGLFGEMAEHTLLASTRVLPRKLLESGFKFRHSDLRAVLGHLLGRA